MRLAFRADAGLAIGTGHVMRCLTLARVMAARGHGCRFVSRDLPGNLNHQIAAEFPLTVLPAPEPGFRPLSGAPAHAEWAGVEWRQDAAQTGAALTGGGVDWLVLDHYAFDHRWQSALRTTGCRVMVLDDLADRPHDCDLLLDQNLGRLDRDYDALLPAGAERLIGPHWALLRPEFAAARPAALARRGAPLRRVLLTMGGIDRDDATGRVLSALAGLPSAQGLEVNVVMGAAAPHLARVRSLAAALPFPCAVVAGVSDMADRMAWADLAIGAAGGTSWERCVLGLPVLVAVLAQNQQAGAGALVAAGAALPLGDPLDAGLRGRLDQALRRLADPAALAALADRAAALCDGLGAERVAATLEQPLDIRPATMADAETVWRWRAALPPDQFRAGGNPPLADHLGWFARALQDPQRLLLMAGSAGPMAQLRLDLSDGAAVVSILLAPEARGRGLGRRLLAALEPLARSRGLTCLRAEVAPQNSASMALFAAAGYERDPDLDGFAQFTRRLGPGSSPLQSNGPGRTSGAKEPGP